MIGISPEQEEEALKELDEWRTRQADNYGNKTADYVKFCHKQIEKIERYMVPSLRTSDVFHTGHTKL